MSNVRRRMRGQLFTALVTLAFAGQCLALDASDVGVYRVLNQQGAPTPKMFRLAGSVGAWRIEDKQPDGSWVDITCEGGCQLNASSKPDQQRFFPGDDLSKVSMSCLHNNAFAFCRYSRGSVPGERGYVFVALTEQHPIALRVTRE